MDAVTSLFEQVPYGENAINAQEIADNLAIFDNWQDRYRYIIDLGKALPVLPSSLKTREYLVPGCQSQVWLYSETSTAGRMHFAADSDALIVRGLIAILLSALNNKTRADVIACDMDDWLSQLGLLQHLTQARGNGLTAMVHKIKSIASSGERT